MADRPEFASSADGTPIAFERLGGGPPVVVLGGIFNTRNTTRALAERLAERFTVINPDRRGRGDSGGGEPYSIEAEVGDVVALLGAAGEGACLYGHSSGAGLALRAAAAGAPVRRLVLHEPPYNGDRPEELEAARLLGERIELAITEDRRADAIGHFFAGMGMPPEAVEGIASDPGMLELAPTMVNDIAVMGNVTRGGVIPEELVAAIRVPTLVLAGTASPEFFRVAATRIAELLPDGRLELLEGADHGAPAELVAPIVERFLDG